MFRAYEHVYPKVGDLIGSTAVARVNGYVSGHGDIDSKEDMSCLGLSEKGKERLYETWNSARPAEGDAYCELPG